MPKKKEPKLYTITEAAIAAGITAQGVHKAIQRGKLKAQRIGVVTGPIWIITEADLNDWLQHKRKRPGRPKKTI